MNDSIPITFGAFIKSVRSLYLIQPCSQTIRKSPSSNMLYIHNEIRSGRLDFAQIKTCDELAKPICLPFDTVYYAPAPREVRIKRRIASDVCLSVAYIGPMPRTERPRKTKIGIEVAHITRDSDTTFKVKRSEVNLQGRGHIVAASRTACYSGKFG